MKGKLSMALAGVLTGIANGFFGSGGGVIAVPMLKGQGLEVKKAHACSLAVTLPLSAVSVFFYSREHSIDMGSALPLIPFGLAGAVLGTYLMKKIPTRWLSRIFGVLLIAAGIRGLVI